MNMCGLKSKKDLSFYIHKICVERVREKVSAARRLWSNEDTQNNNSRGKRPRRERVERKRNNSRPQADPKTGV